ncbi:hypothetical protein STRDD11_01303 [Streptococcus sp. DD11]|nr:hypothetical protein STRDD11_01303 [Streptococcus sp. DD11]
MKRTFQYQQDDYAIFLSHFSVLSLFSLSASLLIISFFFYSLLVCF